jgi:arginyl-tRNA synthetase
LSDLLDEAERRALEIVSQKNPELSESQRQEIARVVASAASNTPTCCQTAKRLRFQLGQELALNGNSAPYLLFAYARVRSIFRKGQIDNANLSLSELNLSAAEEFALAKHLLNFGFVLEAAGEEYRPNYLCNYLYELAGHFARFFESCPVLKSEGATRATRLLLCDLTAKVLQARPECARNRDAGTDC